ncbi:MAG: DNA repair protein RecO [Pseudomonadota bacterium]
MDWRDEGILLTVRRHGESAAIIDVFTAEHGRHAGVVRGGASRRMAPLLQPGAQIAVEWRARLQEHLGAYRVEPVRSRAATLMADGDCLAAVGSVAALLTAYLGEREPHPDFYAATVTLMDLIGTDADWLSAYVGWELMLLSELGFPLSLSSCASTGTTDDLVWVSPRTGHAVSAAAGTPYADRLLPLPPFLTGGTIDRQGLVDGLALTSHFLTKWAGPAFGSTDMPNARARFADRLSRSI